jgi:hypothetical protein
LLNNDKKGAYIMKSSLHFLPLVMLISCASVQSTTLEQDGKQVHRVSCSEFNTSQQECQAKAKAFCAHEPQRMTYYKEEFADAGDGIYIPTRHHYTVECKA